jgi:hypothetical protein
MVINYEEINYELDEWEKFNNCFPTWKSSSSNLNFLF